MGVDLFPMRSGAVAQPPRSRVRPESPALSPLVDLAGWLLEHGWATVLPTYHALERIARAHGRGLWVFQADEAR